MGSARPPPSCPCFSGERARAHQDSTEGPSIAGGAFSRLSSRRSSFFLAIVEAYAHKWLRAGKGRCRTMLSCSTQSHFGPSTQTKHGRLSVAWLLSQNQLLDPVSALATVFPKRRSHLDPVRQRLLILNRTENQKAVRDSLSPMQLSELNAFTLLGIF